jgi:hypothetical protein
MTAFDAWIAQARAVKIEDVVARRGIKLKRVGAERVGPCPKCGGTDRFAINPAKGVFNCRVCGAAGDVISLVQFLDGGDFNSACTTLAGTPPPKANGKARDAASKQVVASFEYLDQNGGVAFAVDRIQFRKSDGDYILKNGKPDKTFRQKRPDPDRPGQWINKVTDGNGRLVPAIPYRLPELIAAVAEQKTVLIVEGEAKVDLLRAWNVPATCCPGGSGKWGAEHSAFLRGADVVIVPDNDSAGLAHVETVAASLNDVAASIRVLQLPHLPDRGDVVDWAKAGGTVEQLHQLITQQAKPWSPNSDKPKTNTGFLLHWHGDDDVANRPRRWLVEGLLPETGSGLISGQWGTYKTFVALDLAAAVMAGGSFVTYAVARRGGVLFIAAEGAGEIGIRLEAVLQSKFSEIKRAPFAWADLSLQLVDPDSAEQLVAIAGQAATHLRSAFDLPLALIVIDTLVASAGYHKSGDENDAATNQAIMNKLAALARDTGALVLGVDHFGKTAETGTRGSSAKEGAADVVLACLGDKAVSGALGNMRLALRKSRVGAAGQEFPFTVGMVEIGRAGLTSLVINWGAPIEPNTAKTKTTGWSKSLRLLQRALMNVLVDHGHDCAPFADGPTVRAVDIEIVRSEFYKSMVSDGDAATKQAAKRQAFNRAVRDAQERSLIGVREVKDKTLVWLTTTPPPQ